MINDNMDYVNDEGFEIQNNEVGHNNNNHSEKTTPVPPVLAPSAASVAPDLFPVLPRTPHYRAL